MDPTIPEEEFIEFMPRPKDQLPMTPLLMPVDAPKISMCYSWEFVRTKGRKILRGRGEDSDTAAGITAYCRMVAGNSSPGQLKIMVICIISRL